MSEKELVELCSLGETTTTQYKLEFTTPKQMAEELVAFANTRGGVIIFGVEDKTGKMVGLSYEQLQYTSRELANTANEHVRPTIYIDIDTVRHDGKAFLIAYVKSGLYKPYKDLSGNIWVKQGADKRRVTDNAEIKRLLQRSHQYQADTDGVENSSEADIDTKALDEYFSHVYSKGVDDFNISHENVLRNAHITDSIGQLTIAGVMFFAKNPQQFRPQHCIKAVCFVGNELGGTEYRDSRDITGTIPEMYDEAIRWLKSCLNRPQNGKSFNSTGDLEIPEIVLEELTQNALVHLDLLKPAAIRLLVFDNRIEIINPGCLPDGQTIDEIMMGNSDSRNPQIALFGSKTMPYRGLGSGIPRVMSAGCDVELINHADGNQFIARIWRTTQKNEDTTQKPINVAGQVTGQVTGQVAGQVERLILAIGGDTLSRQEIMDKLSLKGKDNFRKQYLIPAIKQQLVNMLYPQEPNRPNQKYCLSSQGIVLWKTLRASNNGDR